MTCAITNNINLKKIIFLTCLIIFFSSTAQTEILNLKLKKSELNFFINNKLNTKFLYSGLASSYNNFNAYIMNNDFITRVNYEKIYNLKSNQSLIIKSNHKIIIVENIESGLTFKNNQIIWKKNTVNKKKIDENILDIKLLLNSDLLSLDENFQKLKYVNLWEPLRLLCIFIEKILLSINSIHIYGWGITIVIFSLIFKLIILPITFFQSKSLRKADKIKESLSGDLEYIKSNLSGEEAHNKFLEAHRLKGVTLFYQFKPFVFTLLYLPILIAIFNVLGELDQLSGESFLWIKDLKYPDYIFNFGFKIPLLGESLNLLPFLMSFVSLLSIKKNNKNYFYFMTAGFFFIFYPFPSAMVLFWTLANIWSFALSKFI